MPSKYLNYKNFISVLFDYMQGFNKIAVKLELQKRERKGYLDTIVEGPEDLPYAIKSINLSKNKNISINTLFDTYVREFCDSLRDNIQKHNEKAKDYDEKHKLEIRLNELKPSLKYDLTFDKSITPRWIIVRQD